MAVRSCSPAGWPLGYSCASPARVAAAPAKSTCSETRAFPLPPRAVTAHSLLMAWFRKEKKPRQPRRERLEIPADVWEKCEACGHTDIREKFERNFNVCPNCDYHRRIRANDYCNILLDDGSMEELELDIRSTDPLGFPEYPGRLKKATANARDGDAFV